MFAVCHWGPGDEERRDAAVVIGSLTVVAKSGPGSAHPERAARNTNPSLHLRVAGRRRQPARWDVVPCREHLKRLENGLGMLCLVLGDHVKDRSISDQRIAGIIEVSPCQELKHIGTHARQIVMACVGVENLDLTADRPGCLERVICRLETGVPRWPPPDPLDQPEFLVGRDVTEIPERWAEDRIGAPREPDIVEGREKLKCPRAYTLEAVRDQRGAGTHLLRVVSSECPRQRGISHSEPSHHPRFTLVTNRPRPGRRRVRRDGRPWTCSRYRSLVGHR